METHSSDLNVATALSPTTDELHQWESQYVFGTKGLMMWLETRLREANVLVSKQVFPIGSAARIKELSEQVVKLGAILPVMGNLQWRKTVEARNKILKYERWRVEPWDTQRLVWIRQHEEYALAIKEAYDLIYEHCYRDTIEDQVRGA